MNEKTSVVEKKPGAAAQPGTPPLVASQPPVPAVAVAAPVAQSPAAFGGHRGGGKKRLDGLPAGSPEAKEADRKADAERKRLERSAKKGTPLPPPLPVLAGAGASATVPLAAASTAVPVAPGGVALPAVAAPTFVAWNGKLLEKPARLLTKILDRVRLWQLTKKVKALKLEAADEKEIIGDLKWKEEALNDFNAALADAATVELNKRSVSGAANSHWIALAMTGGELAYSHFEVLNRLESLALKQRELDKEKPVAKN